MDTAQYRYIREETLAEVYDTDERGPHIKPVDVIYMSQWRDMLTGELVTDESVLKRLNREYPAQHGET
jgi:hypothetical protein